MKNKIFITLLFSFIFLITITSTSALKAELLAPACFPDSYGQEALCLEGWVDGYSGDYYCAEGSIELCDYGCYETFGDNVADYCLSPSGTSNEYTFDYDYYSGVRIPQISDPHDYALETSSLFNETDGYIHQWYRAWNDGDQLHIVYHNSTDGYTWNTPINVTFDGKYEQGLLPYVLDNGTNYLMFIPNYINESSESGIDIRVYSADYHTPYTWTSECGGGEITTGGYKKNPAVWFNETDGTFEALFEEGSGNFNIYHWTSSSLCSGWTKGDHMFGDNAGNADIELRGNEFVVYFGDMSVSQEDMQISVWKGTALDNLTSIGKFVVNTSAGVWVGDHLSNPDVVVLDAGFTNRYLIYFSGADLYTGIAYDSGNRGFDTVHLTTANDNVTTYIPSSETNESFIQYETIYFISVIIR